MGVRSLRVDCGALTYLPVCQHCAWRGLPRLGRAEAGRVADDHAARMHADRAAQNAIDQRRARSVA